MATPSHNTRARTPLAAAFGLVFCLALLVFTHAAKADITSNLLLHYTLDDNAANTTVVDTGSKSSNGTASTNTSSLHITGKIGNGAFTLASSSHQYIDTNYTWSSSDHSFTLSAWVKTNQTDDSATILGSYNGQNSIIELGATFQGYAFCTLRDSSGNAGGYTSSTLVNDNRWHLVTCTNNGSLVTLYIDGTLIGTADVTGLTGDYGGVAARSLVIGQTGNTGGFLGGSIDDVRVYNRALSASDVLELAGVDASLFGWWKFEEGVGTTAADSSGNGNTGTFHNSAGWTTGKIGLFAENQLTGTGGSGSYVSTVNSFTAVPMSITYSAWINPTDLTGESTHNIILSTDQGTPWLEVLSNGDLNFSDRNQGNHEYTGATIPLNTWTFVAVTCAVDANNFLSTTTLYINGSQVKQDTGTTDCDFNQPTYNFNIGTYELGVGHFGWTGALDDVRIYTRALSSANIAQLYALGAVASTVISSISVSTTTSTATITWTTDQSASSTVNYGLTSGYGSASTTDTLVTSHEIILSNLSPGTQYHYQVVSGNTSGVSTSSDLTFTTAIDTTPPAISSIASSTLTTTGTVTWNTDESATSKVAYGTVSGSYTLSSTSPSLDTSHSIGLTGLTSGTKYFYVVVSTDSSGNISTSSEKTLTTASMADVTPPVISSIVVSTGTSTATITWSTNESASSTFLFGLSSSYGFASSSASLVTSHSISLSNLSASTTYHYQIGSADASGNLATTSDSTFTTASSTSFTWCTNGSCVTFHNGDIVAIVGDSISSINLWTAYFESYLDLHYPSIHIHFRDISRSGAAIPNYTAPGNQYIGQVDPLGPNEVILMMTNNGGFTQAQYASQVADIINNYIIATSSATPVIFDTPPENTSDGDSLLSLYSEALQSFATSSDVLYAGPVWDYLHTIWLANLSSSTPVDIQDGGDADHMGPPAHLGIAYSYLNTLNADSLVSSTTIDASTATVVSEQDAVVTNVATTSQGINFTRLDARLPMAYDDRSLPIFTIMPQIYDQDKYMLTVTGLSAGDYYVYIDGHPSGSVSSTQLASGWNMSTLDSGPIHDQLQDVLNKIRTKVGLDRVTRAVLSPNTGVVEYLSNANSCYIDQGLTGAALKSCVATAVSDMNTLDNAIYTSAQPTSHTFSLQKVTGNPDTSPAVISDPSPSAPLAQGTTQTTLSVQTDEAASCKYDTVAQTPYIWMANSFTDSVGSTTHSATISGLLDGVTYTYYIRCEDAFGNRNLSDYTLTFSVNADPNPIMYYTFDEGSGSTAADSSGNSHNATLSNSPTWVTGKVGTHALSFDGSTNVGTVGDVSDADGVGALTITAWVKGTGSFVGGNGYNIVTKYASGQGPWTFAYSGASHVYACSIVNNLGTTATALGPTIQLNDANWHHVACVYNGTNLTVYTDGATSTNAVDSPALTGAIKDTTYPVCIGGISDGVNSCETGAGTWLGTIDDLKVYKRALSAQEVMDQYEQAAPVISNAATSTTTTTATITWDTDVIASSTINYGATSSYGTASTSDSFVTSHSITLAGLQPSTLYHYQIASAGSNGAISTTSDSTFTTAATVDTIPPVISSVATSTGANTATITWTTDEGSDSSVSYGLTTGYGNASTTAALVTSHTILLSGLTGSTFYHFKISSTDGSNNTANTSDLNFTTTADIAAAPSITTSAASAVGTSTGTLNGSITSTHGFDASQSGFAYGTTADLHTVISTSTLGSQTGTASFSLPLTGLTANTTYYFRAYATNIQGTGYGSIQSFTTIAVSKPTVTTQAATSVTDTGAIANGTITATGNIDPTVRGFVYGTTAGYGATTTPQNGDFSTGAFTGSIMSLTCGTTYHYAAYATNVQGTGYGSDMTFTPACLSLLSSVAASPNTTSTTIAWNSDVLASSKVDFGINTSYGTSTPELDTSPRVFSHSVTLAPLVPCTFYHYRVSSKDAAGTQVIGSDATFTTGGCTASAGISTTTATDIAGSGGTLNAKDSNSLGLALTVPASFSSTTSQASFQAKKLDSSAFFSGVAAPSGLTLVGGYLYNLEALADATTSLHSFDNPLTVTIAYADGDAVNFDTGTLVIERWDGSVWVPLSGNTVSTTTKTVTATTTNFSDFGLFGVYTPPPTNNGGGSSSSSSSSGGGGGYPATSFLNTLFLQNDPLCPLAFICVKAPAATTTVPAPASPKIVSPLSLALVFTRNLYIGMKGNDVKQLQIFLNLHGFTVAKSGPGSRGSETTFFGSATEAAVNRFQAAYAKDILYPSGFKRPTGTFGPASRKEAVKISMGQL